MKAFATRCLAAALIIAAGPALGQTAPDMLSFEGQLAHPAKLGLANLQHLPVTNITVTNTTEHGSRTATFVGTLLWPILEHDGIVDQAGRKTHLQHIILARGRDGYEVALSIAELDPGFAGKQVLIAYQQDGKPLDGLQLVVPGDRKAGREVRNLVAIEVR